MCTDAYNHGVEQPSFDGNVWWTTDTASVFSWWNGSGTYYYDTFAAFQAGTSQEAHGAFGKPGTGDDSVPTKGALVVDRAIPIPGINDHFAGAAPDVGAYELGGAGNHAGHRRRLPHVELGGATAGAGGGGGNAGSGGSGGSGDSNAGGCGCRLAQGGPSPSAATLLGLLALGMFGRRARAHAPPEGAETGTRQIIYTTAVRLGAGARRGRWDCRGLSPP